VNQPFWCAATTRGWEFEGHDRQRLRRCTAACLPFRSAGLTPNTLLIVWPEVPSLSIITGLRISEQPHDAARLRALFLVRNGHESPVGAPVIPAVMVRPEAPWFRSLRQNQSGFCRWRRLCTLSAFVNGSTQEAGDLRGLAGIVEVSNGWPQDRHLSSRVKPSDHVRQFVKAGADSLCIFERRLLRQSAGPRTSTSLIVGCCKPRTGAGSSVPQRMFGGGVLTEKHRSGGRGRSNACLTRRCGRTSDYSYVSEKRVHTLRRLVSCGVRLSRGACTARIANSRCTRLAPSPANNK